MSPKMIIKFQIYWEFKQKWNDGDYKYNILNKEKLKKKIICVKNDNN